jgi:hypothetical protein
MRFHEPRCEHATGRNQLRPGRVVWLWLSEERTVGRYLLLWLIGVPIPILLLIWAFGGLH